MGTLDQRKHRAVQLCTEAPKTIPLSMAHRDQFLMVMSHLKVKLKAKMVKVKAEMAHRDQVLMVMSHLKVKLIVSKYSRWV